MKVKSKMSCPIRKEDGSWTTVIKEFEEEIPDKGRHSLICNKCIEESLSGMSKMVSDGKE